MKLKSKSNCLGSALLLIACSSSDVALEGIDADAVPKLALEEELRIGDVDDPDIGFAQIGPLAVDHESNVFVVERVDMRIRVYDEGGTLLRTIGGNGEGPGEFRTVSRFGVVGDTLWVNDTRLRRITLFTRAGEILATVPGNGVLFETEDPAINLRIRPDVMREDGMFTSRRTWSLSGQPGGAGGNTIRAPSLLFDATGAVVDTVRWENATVPDIFGALDPPDMIRVAGRSIRRPLPPSDDPLRFDLDGDSLIVERPVATTDDAAIFAVTRTRTGGDTVFHRTFRYAPRGYEPAQVDSMVRSTARIPTAPVETPGGIVSAGPPSDAELVAIERAVRDALVLPPFEPPVSTRRESQDDSIWLRREWDGGPDDRWLILEPDGTPRGELTVPRGLGLYWTAGDTVWAVEQDEFDVPWLVRFRIVAS